MNRSESKYYNTACLMDEALLLLLEKKDFDYITVKEICNKAGVNRSTFYLHYENMNDLLEESLAYIFLQFTKRYENVKIDGQTILNCPIEELYLITPNYIIPYLQFLKDYKKIFLMALSKPRIFNINKYFDDIYDEIFEIILTRFNVPSLERKYMLAYYISGMHAIIIEWIKGGCSEDANYIANLMLKYIPTIK